MRGFGTTENSALLAIFASEACNYRKEKRAMNNLVSSQGEELALRIDDSNLNHHLWNNNGTWWIHYTIYPTPVTVERIRRSLKTKNLQEARIRRDEILEKLLSQARRLAA
jgi:hypothetical protein